MYGHGMNGFGASFAALTRLGEAYGEIAALAPRVVALRTDAAIGAMTRPSAMAPDEPLRMIVEKFDALMEGAMAATLEAGLAVGRGFAGQGDPIAVMSGIATAAMAPTRHRLRVNLARLDRPNLPALAAE
ncbi:hypothetical protein EYW49_04890 [Siculibacillus lacustris]|uniref:Uncharacterized protein n=1 Tax=Siculibacillus lacustris TaxID=1549641 RepID=A0A4Q9VVY1_9HYPH|nr:hypothetical protein [Siculibacillus lacustris]TBW40010.1 hypothetical protein EYW49_04890 [Siculibacillus lacustris]